MNKLEKLKQELKADFDAQIELNNAHIFSRECGTCGHPTPQQNRRLIDGIFPHNGEIKLYDAGIWMEERYRDYRATKARLCLVCGTYAIGQNVEHTFKIK